MYTKEETDLIVLSSFNELSYSVKRAILSEENCENKKQMLIKTLPDGVYNKVKSKFSDGGYRERLLKILEGKGIKCVTYLSEDYPETLKNTYEPPLVLYCKGDTSLLKSNCFSIVGSRRSPSNILAHCRKFSGGLSRVFTIVTGLAEGADTSAIEGALDAGGKVISVLAYGFDFVYPAVNAQLLKRVENKGLVITEQLPDTQPRGYLFPLRNRIIAGLVRGVLVVSAHNQSGALITAKYAEEYDRDIFAFPHSIGVSAGEGCNSLLKNGAYLTDNILDIYKVYGLDFNTHEKIQLNEIESAVYEYIKNCGEAFLPEVAKSLNKLPYEIIPAMTSLQMKGLAANLGGNRYSALDR